MDHYDRLLLIILDGWGNGPDPEKSAIAQADTPFMNHLYKNYPHSTLSTFGEAVGLPEGQMGNSEVGHLNIGAGRIVYQDFARINKAVKEKSLHEHRVLLKELQAAKARGGNLHFMGLVSDGGVHSHITYLKALCEIAEEHGPKNSYIHAFMDGRDTAPKGGIHYMQDLEEFLQDKNAKIASFIGRYYAMDRDNRWERIKLAYDLLVHGKGEKVSDIQEAFKANYAADLTDEFLKPHLVLNNNQAAPSLGDNDLVICFNFRTDRCREISQALSQKAISDYEMSPLKFKYITMTRYDKSFENIEVLFDKENLKETLGEIISKAGKTQVRIAETEKYPHVSYFFSGGQEQPFEGERRIMIPSPKVATYDLKPSRSALKVTDAIINDIEKNQADFICLNYANADMVGHTGLMKAAIQAVEAVDGCVHNLIKVALRSDYAVVVIADHGNSDFMVNDDGSPNTAHTTNPVPFIFVSPDKQKLSFKNGKLADIAPTILTLMNIPIPSSMDGALLINP